MLALRLFGRRAFASSAVVGALVGTSLGSGLLRPLFLQQVRGESPLRTGLLLAPSGAGVALSLLAAGRMLNRFGPRAVAVGGLCCSLVGGFGYTRIGPHGGYLMLACAMVVSGPGFGAVTVSASTAQFIGLDRADFAQASSAGRVLQQLGICLGTAAFTLALQHDIGGHHGVRQLGAAFAHTFWYPLAVTALALLPAAAMPDRRQFVR